MVSATFCEIYFILQVLLCTFNKVFTFLILQSMPEVTVCNKFYLSEVSFNIFGKVSDFEWSPGLPDLTNPQASSTEYNSGLCVWPLHHDFSLLSASSEIPSTYYMDEKGRILNWISFWPSLHFELFLILILLLLDSSELMFFLFLLHLFSWVNRGYVQILVWLLESEPLTLGLERLVETRIHLFIDSVRMFINISNRFICWQIRKQADCLYSMVAPQKNGTAYFW